MQLSAPNEGSACQWSTSPDRTNKMLITRRLCLKWAATRRAFPRSKSKYQSCPRTNERLSVKNMSSAGKSKPFVTRLKHSNRNKKALVRRIGSHVCTLCFKLLIGAPAVSKRTHKTSSMSISKWAMIRPLSLIKSPWKSGEYRAGVRWTIKIQFLVFQRLLSSSRVARIYSLKPKTPRLTLTWRDWTRKRVRSNFWVMISKSLTIRIVIVKTAWMARMPHNQNGSNECQVREESSCTIIRNLSSKQRSI